VARCLEGNTVSSRRFHLRIWEVEEDPRPWRPVPTGSREGRTMAAVNPFCGFGMGGRDCHA
jgi:hypothetical protein